jgi:hypothetical protein
MKKTLILLFIASLFAFSCKKEDKKEDTPKPNPITFVNFIKLNNQWDYNYFVNDVQGTDYTWKITEILNNGYCKVRISTENINSDKYWYSNASFFSDDEYSYPPNYHFALLKNNVSVSDEWQMNISDEGQEYTVTRKVEAINETIIVDAGNYVCVKIKETVSNDPNIINYYWVNKDVGIVQRHFTGWADEGNGRVYFTQKFYLKNVLLN